MIENVSEEVDAARRDRENLVITFYFELEIHPEKFADLGEKLVQRCLIGRQDHEVVGISEVISDALFFFNPVVEPSQIEIGEILG